VNNNQVPFTLLTHEEFAKLSTDEKIKYLARAIEAFGRGTELDLSESTPSTNTQ